MKIIKKLKVSWLNQVGLSVIFLFLFQFSFAQCGLIYPSKLVYISKDIYNKDANPLQDVYLPISFKPDSITAVTWDAGSQQNLFDFSDPQKPKILLSQLNHDLYAITSFELKASCGIRSIYIPITFFPAIHPRNAITGNSDSVNDFWDIMNIEKFKSPLPVVKLFDRWGNVVFESKDGYRLDKFNGYNKSGDKFLPTGTYVYSIIAHPDYPELMGDLTLIR
ncbi:MAG: hypothetical protein RI995_801 [Bacteroidota bacterium]